MPRVLIVDDHVILRRGLRGILDTHPGWECCGEADCGEAAIDGALSFSPDVVIMDVSMPGIGGIKATKILRGKIPHAKVVLLTLHQSTELLRAGLLAGATGYVLKTDGEEHLIAALEAVMRSEIYVTPAVNSEVASKIVREILSPASQETLISAKTAAGSQT
jgi:DNA-binding NarL/FixJ family response regulator